MHIQLLSVFKTIEKQVRQCRIEVLVSILSVHEGRIYQLKLFCDKDYPEKSPTVRFHSRINMTCVNHETGVVEAKKFGILANWQREYTMEDILTQLKKEMAAPHNRKLVQPPEEDDVVTLVVVSSYDV
ncbi:hypothetical protein R6Q59_024494 [Mikania micrantha]